MTNTTMFDFEGRQSHMPYVLRDMDTAMLVAACSFKIDDAWKVHVNFDGEWRRVNTGLPDTAVECSPLLWRDLDRRCWRLSFIGGGYDEDPRLFLYDVSYPGTSREKVSRILQSDFGFYWKNRFAYGGRRDPIFVAYAHADITRKIRIRDLEYTYRVTNNPMAPNELIVSGKTKDDEFQTWIVNSETNRLWRLEVNGQPPYKACLLGDVCFYAEKCGPDFEDRRIVSSSEYTRKEVSFDEFATAEVLEHSLMFRDVHVVSGGRG